MKRIIMLFLLLFGILLAASESHTFIPNIIGVMMMLYSSLNLELYGGKR